MIRPVIFVLVAGGLGLWLVMHRPPGDDEHLALPPESLALLRDDLSSIFAVAQYALLGILLLAIVLLGVRLGLVPAPRLQTRLISLGLALFSKERPSAEQQRPQDPQMRGDEDD